jgi:hypothetical protein
LFFQSMEVGAWLKRIGCPILPAHFMMTCVSRR